MTNVDESGGSQFSAVSPENLIRAVGQSEDSARTVSCLLLGNQITRGHFPITSRGKTLNYLPPQILAVIPRSQTRSEP